MSFPVAGTLMVGSSSPPAEVDAFCRRDDRHPRRDRSRGIGRVAGRRQPLRNARTRPSACSWTSGITHTREQAAYPLGTGFRAEGVGRRCVVSTALTETAIWCAPARRWKNSRTVDDRGASGLSASGVTAAAWCPRAAGECSSDPRRRVRPDHPAAARISFQLLRFSPGGRTPQRTAWLAPDFGSGLSDKPRPHRYSLPRAGRHRRGPGGADRAADGPVVLIAHDMGTSVATELLARDLTGRPSFDLQRAVPPTAA